MYKALISFSGKVSATIGDTIEIKDEAIAKDLLKAGYIEPVEAEKPKAKAEAKKK